MGHRALGILVGVVGELVGDHVVDEGRGVPQGGEDEVDVGTHGTGLGDGTLGGVGHTAFGQAVLEVVDHEVAGVVGHEQALVQVLDGRVSGVVAELVQGGHEVVVTEVGTGGKHVVAAVVEAGLVMGVDGAAVLGDDVLGELCVSRQEGRFAIFVGLVEGLVGDHALLGDVQILLTGNTHEKGGDGEDRINYFFHIPYSFKH